MRKYIKKLREFQLNLSFCHSFLVSFLLSAHILQSSPSSNPHSRLPRTKVFRSCSRLITYASNNRGYAMCLQNVFLGSFIKGWLLRANFTKWTQVGTKIIIQFVRSSRYIINITFQSARVIHSVAAKIMKNCSRMLTSSTIALIWLEKLSDEDFLTWFFQRRNELFILFLFEQYFSSASERVGGHCDTYDKWWTEHKERRTH